eukprot:Clim_evm95s11 gene=Clim_evmTU95s11
MDVTTQGTDFEQEVKAYSKESMCSMDRRIREIERGNEDLKAEHQHLLDICTKSGNAFYDGEETHTPDVTE